MTTASALNDVLSTIRDLEFGAYLVALDSSGLRSQLEKKGPFTVFIPTDAAFERFSKKELEELVADSDALRRLIQYSIVPGALTSDALALLDSAETLGRERIEIDAANGVRVDEFPLSATDVECSNGIVHIVEEVPIPPSLRKRFGKNAKKSENETSEYDPLDEKISVENPKKFEKDLRRRVDEERIAAPETELSDKSAAD